MSGLPDARWRVLTQDRPGAQRLAAALGIGAITGQVLLNRGFVDPVLARAFLDAGAREPEPPSSLAHMERVGRRLAQATRERTPIVVYGDYDADGVTATAILVRALRAAGASVEFYVPDRRTEGYGLHAGAVTRLAQAGARVLVAVDCGITAQHAAEAAASAAVDLMILDHHLPLTDLPPAYAIVNPRIGGTPTEYCAAGLAYQAVRAFWQAMGTAGDDPSLVALAAIGTVADSVSLLGENRVIAARGLAQLQRTTLPGLRALLDVAALQGPLSVRDIAFGIAPRVNAAGRLAHAKSAVDLFLTDDASAARHIAEQLNAWNLERRALCDRTLAEAVEAIESSGLAREPAIVVSREGWHAGVVGIVASQIVERYHRPAVVIAVSEGIGKGSARSIPPLHLVEAITEASAPLIAYGGHAMAAGLSVSADAVDQFRTAFVEAVSGRLRAEDLVPVVEIDAELGLDAVTPDLAVELERLAPFGAANPQPVFLTRGLQAVGTRTVGAGAHLRLVVSDGARSAEAIGFRLGDRAELLAFTQAPLDLAYAVERDQWREEQPVQLVVHGLLAPDVDPEAITSDTDQLLGRLFAGGDHYLDPDRRDIEDAAAFHTKVVGVSFEGRQAVVASVRAGDLLRLQRDPANPQDPHAVKVCLDDGRQVGFLRAALAARLAPAMDTGARYAATATALTGGGDRAWGLNIFVERQAPWFGVVAGAETAVQPPAGDAFLEWTGARLLRGRPLTPLQREIVQVLMQGGRAAARHGPGRGLPVALAVAAASLLTGSVGPVLMVLPRAAEVDAWIGAAGPWLRSAGLRVLGAHGALTARRRARVDETLERRAVDVVAASAAWVLARLPEVGGVIVAADDVMAGADLDGLRGYYGDRVRLATGPAQVDRLLLATGSAGTVVPAAPLEPRTNLRVVDRRGRTESGSAPGAATPRLDRTVVIASGPRTAVAQARRMRDEAETAGRVAYYHDGLPATVRRVLEDLFASGRIDTLVLGSPIIHPAAAIDVNRVLAAGLPASRWLAAECLGLAGGRGQVATIELRYDAETLGLLAADLEVKSPSRESLIRSYHYLKELNPSGSWTWPGAMPPGTAPPGLPFDLLSVALEIFLEAGVVSAEGGEGRLVRYTLVDSNTRVDLERSLRYREAVRERAAHADLRAWATGPASGILTELARP